MLLALLLCAGIPIAIGLIRFWDREFSPVTFHFHYENFEGFACTTWQDYQTQTESLTLLNGMTMITMTENSVLDTLKMGVTFTSTASGAVLTASGQYVRLFRSGVDNIIEDVGDPFSISTDGVLLTLDLSAIEWFDCYNTGISGYALELTFNIDKSGITETETGDYTYTVDLNVGTE